MRTSSSFVFLRFIMLLTLAACHTQVSAAPGDLDASFGSGLAINNAPVAMAVQPDGKVILAGKSFIINGRTRHGLFRLNADGTLDLSFQPETFPGTNITSIAVKDDGRILVAGVLATTSFGIPRATVVRYRSNGSLDSGFQSPSLRGEWIEGTFPSMRLVLLQDQRILVTEEVIESTQTRAYLRRLNANGAIDTSFDKNYVIKDGVVQSIAVQPDGKVVVVGGFTNMYVGAGIYSNFPNIIRFNLDGTYDNTFASGLDHVAGRAIHGVLAQPDGKLILQGVMSYAGVSGSMQLSRMLTNGGRDTTFTSMAVVSSAYGPMKMALQADGKVILALPGTVPSDVAWPGNLLRFNGNGTRDTTFVGNTVKNVTSLCLHSDGKLLVTGEFPARVQQRLNDAGSRQLTLPLANKVRWTRTGAASMPSVVSFEYFDSQGSLALSPPVAYVSGSWEWTGSIPTGPGVIRARATIAGSQDVQTLTLGTPVPEISVATQAALTDNASNLDFSGGLPGTATLRSFEITNRGSGLLGNVAVSIDGPDASAFQVVALPPSSIGSQETSVLVVKFSRGVPKTYNATLHITSTDADEASFEVALTGSASVDALSTLYLTTYFTGIATEGFNATGNYLGAITLGSILNSSSQLIVVNNTSNDPVTGHFINLPDRSLLQAKYASGLGSGAPVTLQIKYDGGDGNDIVLVPVTPAATDPGFTPPTDLEVIAIANQPDGKILIGGHNPATPGRRILRMNLRGEVDTNFNIGTGPDVDGILCLAALDDGKILAGGNFTTFDGVPRAKLVRLHANGSVDTSFQATGLSGTPLFLKILRSGKILVAGSDGLGMKRLLADGTDDTSFLFHREGVPTYFDGRITSVVEATDDSLTAVGSYLYKHGAEPPEGMTLLGLEHFQFEADGRLRGKLQFPSGYGMQASGILIQPDGRLILSGFSGLGSPYLMRWKTDGTLDILDSSPTTSYKVIPATLQADGSIMSVQAPLDFFGQSTVCKRNATGEQDSTFLININPAMGIAQLCVLGSGHVLCTGEEYSLFTPAVYRQALLFTNAATNHLHRTSQNAIRWKRGGGAPEADSVTFDVSDVSGQTWTRLGQGTRAANGEWEITEATLPPAGLIRARARVVGGRFNGSSGLVEYVQAYDSSAPELAVEAPNGTDLQVESAFYNFGVIAQSTPITRSFTLRNTIGGTLNVSAATSGGQQSDFVITTSPSSTLTGGQSTTVTVTFTPATLGTRTTTLQITSNDPDESPFLVELSGTGVTAQQGWRHQHFNSADNTGDAADLADFDKDGLLNLMEFAFDLDPKSGNATNGAAKLPEPVVEGEYLVIRFTPPAAGVAAGLTYGAQASATLEADSWVPVTNTGTGGVHEYKIPLAGELRFMKVTVNGGGN